MATTQLASLSKLIDIPIDSHYDESYIIRLASMSLRELLDEPSRLEMKANSLEREIQTKAIEQNEVFEKAQKCFSDVLEKINSLQLTVSTAYIPTVKYSCSSFSKEVEDTYTKYNQSKKALKYHTQLLELLEMPQLMDTCIRNNLHEEGLVLLHHANALFCEHFPNATPSTIQADSLRSGNSIILSIFREMVAVAEQQETLLIRELETDISTSRCVQIVNYLAQNYALRFNTQQKDALTLDSLSQEQVTEIKTNFLKARDRFFLKKTAVLTEYDQGEYLKGYIAVFKDKCMSVVTQYQAVFGNTMEGFFHNYLMQEVTNFVDVFDKHIKKVISGSLLASLFRDVVVETRSCCTAMRRRRSCCRGICWRCRCWRSWRATPSATTTHTRSSPLRMPLR